MTGIVTAVGSLILGISLIQLANGYIGTLIGIRLADAHVDPVVTGIVTSAYFAGYALGAALCYRLIGRAGHIRAFAAFAALVAAAFLGHALYFNPALWAVLRALVGFGCAGLFVATESWLNAKATAATRGTVFAIYMVATYATFAGGQFMLNLASPTAFTLFALAAILFCLALAVVTTTRAEQPLPVASSHLKLGELLAAAPVAVVGCLAGGIVSGSFYALVPVYAQLNGRSVLEISSYMALAITGGLLIQIPIGKLSDRLRSPPRRRPRRLRLRRPGPGDFTGAADAVVPRCMAPPRRLHVGHLSGLRGACERPHARRARRRRERPSDPDLRHRLGRRAAPGRRCDVGIRHTRALPLHGGGDGAFRALCTGAPPERARVAVQAAQTVPVASRHLRARSRPRLPGAHAMITQPTPTGFKE